MKGAISAFLQRVADDHLPLRQALEHGRADVLRGHDLGHRGAGHARDVAEIVEHQHRHRQDQLDRVEAAGHRRGAGQPAQLEDEQRHEEGGRGELRHRGGEDRDERDRPVERRALPHPGEHAQQQGERDHDREHAQGEDAGVAEPVPEQVVDRRLEADRVAEVALQRVADPLDVAHRGTPGCSRSPRATARAARSRSRARAPCRRRRACRSRTPTNSTNDTTAMISSMEARRRAASISIG